MTEMPETLEILSTAGNTAVAPPSSRLASLFAARSVAIVGASADPGKITGRPLAYMLARGFTGALYPVNPGRKEVQGLPAYPTLGAIGKPVDLAIVGTAAEQVEAVIQEGIDVGIKAFVVFSSGFAETGEAGRALQQRLSALARANDVAILGPNCLGLANSATGLIASFTTALESSPLLPGRFAFVSQSGALGAYWLDIVLRSGLGFSQWISTGNECDVDAGEAIDFLVDDPDTDVIGLYLEDIRDTQSFRRALQRAAMAHKTVIAIKSGRSNAGAQAAASHTGALAGDDALYDACLRQFGALRVGSLSEMIDAARLYLCKSVPQGNRLAIMSVSGGAGVLIADESEALGMQLPGFCDATNAVLKTVLPSFAHTSNPLDLTGNVVQNTASISTALTAVAADESVDAIVLFVGLMHSIAGAFTDALADARRLTPKPIIVIWIGAMPETIQRVEAAGIPVFADIPQAMRALQATRELAQLKAQARNSAQVSTPLKRSQPTTATEVAIAHLSEWNGKQLLRGQSWVGMPQGWLLQQGEAIPDHLPYPLVAKLQSAQLLHKSDAGGVILKIQDQAALESAISRLRKIGQALKIPVQGVLIEQMLPFDHELLLGLRNDERFGPVLTIARGGVEAEADPDVANVLLPASEDEILRALQGLRYARLLNGYRGRPAADMEALAERITGLSVWFMGQALLELEINPLAIQGSHAWALDALMAPARA